MTRAALLVAALMFAGCVAPSASVDPSSAIARPPLLDALAMDQESDGGEPTIAVLDERTIFVTAKAGNQDEPSIAEGASWLWRSTDGGASWETLREPTRAVPTTPVTREPVRATDPDVVVSPDGWVYYLDWWIARTPWQRGPIPQPVPVPGRAVTNFVVEASADAGETWRSTPITIPMLEGMAVDRPWLVAGPDGYVAIFYWAGTASLSVPGGVASVPLNEASGIHVVVSSDHGETWSAPTEAVADTDERGLVIARPSMLPSGRLILPFGVILYSGTGDWLADPGEARVAWSDDRGATWTETKIADVPGGFEQIWPLQGAVAPDGRAYVAWGERRGDALSLWISASDDGAITWSAPVLAADAGANILPWVAAMSDRRVAVGYYHADLVGKPRGNETTWYAELAESHDGGATFATMRVAQPAKVGIICPEGTRCEEDRVSNRELQDYVGLAYGPDGALHFSYTKSRELGGALTGHIHYTKVVRT